MATTTTEEKKTKVSLASRRCKRINPEGIRLQPEIPVNYHDAWSEVVRTLSEGNVLTDLENDDNELISGTIIPLRQGGAGEWLQPSAKLWIINTTLPLSKDNAEVHTAKNALMQYNLKDERDGVDIFEVVEDHRIDYDNPEKKKDSKHNFDHQLMDLKNNPEASYDVCYMAYRLRERVTSKRLYLTILAPCSKLFTAILEDEVLGDPQQVEEISIVWYSGGYNLRKGYSLQKFLDELPPTKPAVVVYDLSRDILFKDVNGFKAPDWLKSMSDVLDDDKWKIIERTDPIKFRLYLGLQAPLNSYLISLNSIFDSQMVAQLNKDEKDKHDEKVRVLAELYEKNFTGYREMLKQMFYDEKTNQWSNLIVPKKVSTILNPSVDMPNGDCSIGLGLYLYCSGFPFRLETGGWDVDDKGEWSRIVPDSKPTTCLRLVLDYDINLLKSKIQQYYMDLLLGSWQIRDVCRQFHHHLQFHTVTTTTTEKKVKVERGNGV